MNRERRFLFAVAGLVLVSVGGTVGYVLVEGASFSDALYMTVITISTVGFGEVFPLTDAGRLLTVGVIVFGVGAALYTAATGVEIGLERFLGGDLRRRRMNRQIEHLDGHVIICGFGRVGANTWRALEDEGIPSVVVESTPAAAEDALQAGALVYEGDATRNETLAAAGADRARAVIACVRNDNDNLVIVLTAKHRWPDLPVISRATEMEAQEKLRLAGADRVVSPQLVGAHRLAALAAEPRLDEFVDLILHGRLVELRIEGVEIGRHSPVAGKLLRDSSLREDSGALVLAVETPSGELLFNPDPEIRLQAGQMVIAIGSSDQVEALREAIGE
jgi:voltage-gated potassium channel